MIREGDILNDTYVIGKEIGSGGGGTVFSAYHNRLKKKVAIKKIHDKGEYVVEELRREADILKNLRHLYLPQVFDFLMLDSGVYTVMDFIEGRSLDEILQDGKKFSEATVVKYGSQLSEVLAYLHSRHPIIIHGDIKPANIMITPEDNICLIDFNISGLADDKGKAYVMGLSKGYAAPEQYEAFRALSVNSKKTSSAKADNQKANDKTEILPTDKTEILINDKTEILSADKTEVLINDKTEIINTAVQDEPSVDKTEVLIPRETEILPGMEVTSKPVEQIEAGSETVGIPVTTQSDVYSVGATMYRLLTGKTIDEGNSNGASYINASDGLCMIINKALDPNPYKRYADAGKLLNAFKNIYKMDKRYKRAIALQQILQVFFILCIAGGIVLFFWGRDKKVRDNDNLYEEYILELIAARQEGNVAEFDRLYDCATELKPDNFPAYYQKAVLYYEERKYADGINYIENAILNNTELYSDVNFSSIYELLGRMYYEVGDYSSSVNAYKSAININSGDGEYYIGCAIALASEQKLDAAQEMLDKAVALGIGNDRISLTSGEILRKEKSYEDALEKFGECLETTTDDYVKMRAYVFSSNTYSDMLADESTADDEKAELCNDQIELLKKAKVDLPIDYTSLIQSELGNAYINAINVTDSESAEYNNYILSAIDVFKEISSNGYSGFATYNNLVVLYEKIGDYESAVGILNSVEEQFKENYAFYKRFAYLEAEIQNSKIVSERSYTKFAEYYKQAKELYSYNANQTDTEMMLLEKMYKDVVDNGWIVD